MQADLRIFAPHIRTAERKLLKTGNIVELLKEVIKGK